MGRQRKAESKEEYNSRMRAYMQKRYKQRRDDAITYLGGRCVDCGLESQLEFDHIDPKLKSYNMGEIFAGKRKDVLQAEVDKCELRCIGCHSIRTAIQKIGFIDILGMPV